MNEIFLSYNLFSKQRIPHVRSSKVTAKKMFLVS